MNESAKTVAQSVIDAARDGGYLDGELAVIPELAEEEKALFIAMFEALRTYLERENRQELTVDEISSMFTFVFAKAAEMVTNFVNRKPEKMSMDGLFDGKVPLYADDTLTGYCKKSIWPMEAGSAFMDCGDKGENPLLALFEALKWTFRVSEHLFIGHLEKRGRL